MKLRVTIEGRVFEVDVEVLSEGFAAAPAAGTPPPVAAPAPAAAPASRPAAAPAPAAAPSGGNVYPSPIAGVIRQVKVKAGDSVQQNQEMLIMEAMKMETPVKAPRAGVVKAVLVNEGSSVTAGQGLVEFA